jgi:hypothetical protein
MLDFDPQKLRLWSIGLMEFNFLKTQTYLYEIWQLFMIHLQFGGAILQGIEEKNGWKIQYLSE